MSAPSQYTSSQAIRAALATVVAGGSLSTAGARSAMAAVMDGDTTPAQSGALLAAMRMRGETTEELTGFALAMRQRATPVDAPDGAIDTCGTGGDGASTFNVSTAVALLVAACGVPVAKHGNRAVTSSCGSADVLEALGVPIDLDAAAAARALRELGFAFLFAPAFHPAMRHAGAVRRELGIPTAFNLLGPITNPARVRRQVVGVADARRARQVALVLQRLGTERALVVHGAGLDELPLDGSGVAYDVSTTGVRRRRVTAEAAGLRAAPTVALGGGGSAAESAERIEAVVSGAERGPARDVVLLNAAAALLVAGRAATLRDGAARASRAIDDGHAATLLERLRAARQRPAA